MTYLIGMLVDGFWVIGLLVPSLFGKLTGRSGFDPSLEIRLILGIAASLMAGWTVLLAWAYRKPVARRGILLITAFPVIFGLFLVSLLGLIQGNAGNIWILIKTGVLMVFFCFSFILASSLEKGNHYDGKDI